MGSHKPTDLNQYDVQRRHLQRALNAISTATSHPARLSILDVQALLSIMIANNLAKPNDIFMTEADIWRHVMGGEAVMDVQSFNKLTLKLSTYQYRKNNGEKVDGSGLVDKSRPSVENRSAVSPVLTKRGQLFVYDFLAALQGPHVPAHSR